MTQKLILRHGDCVEVLKGYEDGSTGAFICDPPYDLTTASRGGSARQFVDNPYGRARVGTDRKGFMGKTWDGTGIAFSADLWDEVYRVLRPGGVVKAFSGTRTFHRMVSAMAEAGFTDLRIESWNYGSGFPKSMNIGKALDKQAGARMYFSAIRIHLRHWRDQRGLSNMDINKLVGSSLTGCGMARHWLTETGTQHLIPSKEMWLKLKAALQWPDCDLDRAYEFVQNGADRPGTGEFRMLPSAPGFADLCSVVYQKENRGNVLVETTLPATEVARTWDGWGTSLKPAFEPIIVALKPKDC